MKRLTMIIGFVCFIFTLSACESGSIDPNITATGTTSVEIVVLTDTTPTSTVRDEIPDPCKKWDNRDFVSREISTQGEDRAGKIRAVGKQIFITHSQVSQKDPFSNLLVSRSFDCARTWFKPDLIDRLQDQSRENDYNDFNGIAHDFIVTPGTSSVLYATWGDVLHSSPVFAVSTNATKKAEWEFDGVTAPDMSVFPMINNNERLLSHKNIVYQVFYDSNNSPGQVQVRSAFDGYLIWYQSHIDIAPTRNLEEFWVHFRDAQIDRDGKIYVFLRVVDKDQTGVYGSQIVSEVVWVGSPYPGGLDWKEYTLSSFDNSLPNYHEEAIQTTIDPSNGKIYQLFRNPQDQKYWIRGFDKNLGSWVNVIKIPIQDFWQVSESGSDYFIVGPASFTVFSRSVLYNDLGEKVFVIRVSKSPDGKIWLPAIKLHEVIMSEETYYDPIKFMVTVSEDGKFHTLLDLPEGFRHKETLNSGIIYKGEWRE